VPDRIADEPLVVPNMLERVAGEGAASCVFAGTVRGANRGRDVVSLTYEAHRPLGERVLRELEEETEATDGVLGCRIRHRVGTLEVGEVSVVVAVAARRHEDALDAARHAMDELKERLPMWKEERYADGESRYLDGSPLRSGDGGAPSGAHDRGEPGMTGGAST